MPGKCQWTIDTYIMKRLEALFPPSIAVSASEPGKTNGEKRSPIMEAVKKRLSQAAEFFA